MRGDGQKLLVKIANTRPNFFWLRNASRTKPGWNSRFTCWEVPSKWFGDVVERLLKHFKQVYVIQSHKELQKCAPACWSARGIPCECNCMGANHGSGQPGGRWYEVSETFAFRSEERYLACRLLTLE